MFHPARQLERIFLQSTLRIGNAHLTQQIDNPLACRLAIQPLMHGKHFTNLLPDGQDRIEAGRRLLKDHRHLVAPPPPHFSFRQRQQIFAIKRDLPIQNAGCRRQQAHQALRRHRFSAPRLTQQGKGFTSGNGKGNTIHRCQSFGARHESQTKFLDFQHHTALGSNASRMASANRLAASTRMNMAANAAASDHQTTGSRPSSIRALLIIVPKLVMVGSTPMPT